LRGVHGAGKVEAGVSDYYLVDEIQGTYRGMMIAIPSQEWEAFSQMAIAQFTDTLAYLASLVNLKAISSTPRGPKKPPLERIHNQESMHCFYSSPLT
jgi:hypothetical protein